MSDYPTLVVSRRSEQGKSAARKIRNEGGIPAVVYGAGKEPVAVRVDRKRLLELFRGGSTENSIFLLRMGETGQERHAMIREMQVDPLNRRVMHLDFQRILMDQKLKVQVKIELTGTAYGVKTEGGVLDFVNRQIEVECLPGRIPHHVEFDVTGLRIGDHVEAAQLTLPQDVVLVDPADRVILSVSHSKGGDAVEAATGEGLIEADKDEPEVIKKGKPTDED